MLTIKLGLPQNQIVAVAAVRWVLNDDESPVSGKNYTWVDSEAWTDANAWKDTGFGL
jgi:hypothetical protein